MATLYVTVPREEADAIAERLLEERLAACVNAVECSSTYRWEGSIEEDREAILLVKTDAERAGDLQDRLRELHPYDVPCIERFEEDWTLPAFAAWRADAVDAGEG